MSIKPETRHQRIREYGGRDFETACAIIDAARHCHVGMTIDDHPYVLPMACARRERELLLHGSVASRLMKALAVAKWVHAWPCLRNQPSTSSACCRSSSMSAIFMTSILTKAANRKNARPTGGRPAGARRCISDTLIAGTGRTLYKT